MSRIPTKMRGIILACRESDAAFFRRRPDRHHRVRLAAHAEIVLARAEGAITAPIPVGVRGFVAVERRPDEALAWALGFEITHTNTDVDERTAHSAFRRFQAHDDATLCNLAERVRIGGATA
ncbi:hypothetical protein FF100_35520 [Methylobacterium terricola]|uniref:Uncharacterized protein n=1 Tax=Methylobacterium terricola TaxID=2583531 RepID=A0A5C4L5B9_9HYPH|nr:hypothetical protein [Methylobacterium terricola]TNC05516.1 hypothetical protein FF100_35520 [Methylobacterium terricola]